LDKNTTCTETTRMYVSSRFTAIEIHDWYPDSAGLVLVSV